MNWVNWVWSCEKTLVETLETQRGAGYHHSHAYSLRYASTVRSKRWDPLESSWLVFQEYMFFRILQSIDKTRRFSSSGSRQQLRASGGRMNLVSATVLVREEWAVSKYGFAPLACVPSPQCHRRRK